MAFTLQIASGGYESKYQFDRLPSECPHCHRNVIPIILAGFEVNSDEVDIFLHCPDDEQCGKGFLGIYENTYLREVSFGTPTVRKFNSEIKSISPQFVAIYNQSYFAEQHNLLEICGVGYRKALEFLLKDYAKLNNPEKQEEIEKQSLGKCISNYVNDARIKNVATRAVWLGNDETHYVRKWQGKNLEDLKKLIELTLHWIEMEMLTKSIVDDMPDSK